MAKKFSPFVESRRRLTSLFKTSTRKGHCRPTPAQEAKKESPLKKKMKKKRRSAGKSKMLDSPAKEKKKKKKMRHERKKRGFTRVSEGGAELPNAMGRRKREGLHASEISNPSPSLYPTAVWGKPKKEETDEEGRKEGTSKAEST